jgi:hypothetical protein
VGVDIELLNASSGHIQLDVELTEVKFRKLSEEQIHRHLDKDKPYNCAGSFHCESLGITLFESIRSNDPKAGENPLILSSLGDKIIQPLTPKQKLGITTIGKEVLSNQINWLDLTELDCWIGGVHLNHDNTWCWDADREMIIKRSKK